MDTEMLVTFRTVRPMSDDEFFEFCQICPDLPGFSY